jgi:hypothetical protein
MPLVTVRVHDAQGALVMASVYDPSIPHEARSLRADVAAGAALALASGYRTTIAPTGSTGRLEAYAARTGSAGRSL